MSGDYSRDSFDALRSFAGVFLQQGRAVLDSDWNEMVALFERRIRAETVDIIGRAVVPRETEQAFEISLVPGGMQFGRGRIYVDGLLAEHFGRADFDGSNPARPAPVFDRGRIEAGRAEGVLDEMISPATGDLTNYLEQPFWPTPVPLPQGGGPHLVYLAVWNREVTPTELPALLEPALGGLDTTTRWQTVWQVRVLQNVGANATCQTPDDELPGWTAITAPSTARLTTATIDIDEPENPCLVPPTDGYTGLENQLYRVEIHGLLNANADPAAQTSWGFKFSRENASVRAAVTAIAADGESLTVSRIGRDQVLRFAPGDWVELTDDRREFNHLSGQMLRVAEVDAETREISFETAIAADLRPSGVGGDTLAARHTRLIRWDQQGIIRRANGTQWVDLDAAASNGLIPVPPDGTVLVLESGITVSFSTAAGPGRFRPMDHWRFAARTAGTQIEILRAAPPVGIQRHHARLAMIRPAAAGAGGQVLDCRTLWPPLMQGGDDCCACTVCVTAESHNSGALTIQQAIDQVGDDGGTVCLEAGQYRLAEPVRIAERRAITLQGQGLGTQLLYQGAGGAVQVIGSVDIQLERFTVFAVPADGAVPVHGIAAQNCALLALRRMAVLVVGPNPEDSFAFGIALDGMQIGSKIEECLVIAPHALGSRVSFPRENDDPPPFAAFAELRVLDSILFGARAGVLIDRAALNLANAILSRNLVLSRGGGVRVKWVELPAAGLSIDASTVIADGTAISLSAGTMRITDCEISGGDEAGDGIILTPNILPQIRTSGQIIGNTIFDLAGAGIRIAGAHDTLFIKRNIIRDIGQAGIVTDPAATVRHLAVDNNSIQRIGLNTGASAVGIGLTSVETAQVVGNSVRTVGNAGGNGQLHLGIGVQGVGSVDIGSNVLSEIGGGQVESRAVGILGMAPYLGLVLGGNRIFGDAEQGEVRSDWRAIRVGQLIEDADLDRGDPGAATNGFPGALPQAGGGDYAYVNVAGNSWAASASHFAVFQPVRAGQVSASANQIRSAQQVIGAIVSMVEPRGALSFAGNQCELQSQSGLREVVMLAAPRVSVQGNTVIHVSDKISLHILTGRTGGATPVGNIVSSMVELRPNGLKPPFDALNIKV
ncbi:DUF6519 domain-containing protein [uncultured Paracoccus sp.]|uniref:DUF6519 domain-containing protein n=1 Tax=uncultured Paracoccus sp. TaxID=189685 RepID=UPI0026362976|nr:DUF6519 domain-containing protein [uncultured Paracoccus sp.]